MKTMRLLAGLVFALSASTVHAVAIYTYTGPSFTDIWDDAPTAYPGTYDESMFVWGRFTLSSLIPDDSSFSDYLALVIDWEFDDGRFTLTPSNSSLTHFDMSTDSNGDPFEWFVVADNFQQTAPHSLGDFFVNISTSSSPSDGQDQGHVLPCIVVENGNCTGGGAADGGRTTLNTGTWTVESVPLPAAVWLFGSGLIGLIGIARRKSA